MVLAGTIIPFAGSSLPESYLICDGQAVSRSIYSTLFGIIGTAYGIGDGSTTFNVPDLRGRVPAGQDDMGGTPANRLTGQPGGVDGSSLGNSGGGETHVLLIAEMPEHDHTVYNNDSDATGSGGGAVSNATGTADVQSAPAGGDGAHNNIQPTLIVTYIIATEDGPDGTVTSVAMEGDGVIYNSSVSGSPITSSGTLTPSLLTQAVNAVLAGPASGGAAAPSFRALAGADLPDPSTSVKGGVKAYNAVTNQWIRSIGTDGTPTSSQPAFSNISGTITTAQLPMATLLANMKTIASYRG